MDELEVCAVPGCETLTDQGICDECDAWVDKMVAELDAPEGEAAHA